MENKHFHINLGNFLLRSPSAEDAEAYYKRNFAPLEPEAARLTGSRTDFTREEVVGFFHKCLADPDRCDLLLLSPTGEIIGESVLNEFDPQAMGANLRICIFHKEDRCRGLGSIALKETLRIAFEELSLSRVTLTVFSFNTHARHLYERAGFRVTQVFRDEIRDGDGFADEIEMAITADQWKNTKQTVTTDNG